MVSGLFSLICTTWLLLAGIQPIRNLGDLARFGTLVFQFLAPLQLLILAFLSALAGAGVVAHEKDRNTLILLLLTSMSNAEVVVGKVLAGLLPTLNLFLVTLPVLFFLPLFGGVTVEQVLACGILTVATMLACAALGATIAFWREKTFQAIAVTLLALVLWLALGEAVAQSKIPGLDPSWSKRISPARAVVEVCQPIPGALDADRIDWFGNPSQSPTWGFSASVALSSACMLLIAGVLTGISLVMLRIWNPSREQRPTAPPETVEDAATEPSAAPSTEFPAVKPWKSRNARRVWKYPILWREMRTWAYGRKVLLIRLAYLVLLLLTGLALQQTIASGSALERSRLNEELIPVAARIMSPFLVVSLVMINALAVNSITNERDSQALDLLLVTEITPAEFLFSKLFGALYVAKEMVLLPLLLVGYLWWQQGISTENAVFLWTALVVMDVFVAMLGIHCGMIYSQSRMGIAVSLGTVFFLFLGVVVCMLIMISFRGSFGRQLAPFLAIILGGGTGLYMALGHRNPSPAITLAAFGLPFLTFFAITSFILRDQELTVFSVIVFAYAFATAAMMVPALSEFDFAMGRSRTVDEDA
jgi:ABC-type transport system involved in multi-copper enzyme maturation permease subunit